MLPLHGAHQADNAAAALTAAECFLGGPLDRGGRRRGVRAPCGRPAGSRSSATQPLVLLDGAHNVAGAQRAAGRAGGGVRRRAAHARRRAAAREGAPRDARGARVPTAPTRARVLPAAEPACARSRARSPPPARDLGVDPTGSRASTPSTEAVARALGARRRRRPDVVTGSLYTVGAARAALVTASDPLAPCTGLPPMSDRTLVLCKPDAVERGLVGEIVGRLERRASRSWRWTCASSTPSSPGSTTPSTTASRSSASWSTFITRSPLVAMVVEGGRRHVAGRAHDDGRDQPARGRAGHDPRRPRPRDDREPRARSDGPESADARDRARSSRISDLAADVPILDRLPRQAVAALDQACLATP